MCACSRDVLGGQLSDTCIVVVSIQADRRQGGHDPPRAEQKLFKRASRRSYLPVASVDYAILRSYLLARFFKSRRSSAMTSAFTEYAVETGIFLVSSVDRHAARSVLLSVAYRTQNGLCCCHQPIHCYSLRDVTAEQESWEINFRRPAKARRQRPWFFSPSHNRKRVVRRPSLFYGHAQHCDASRRYDKR